ncbi:MAG: dienelactone hydrolase family protein [Acidimicrobiaceae bacterium]|nr:dienelactone hydrolase family protein [Acidimicrobiaceae bacterium]
MALNDYLRDEILEEADLGYISQEEKDRQLATFDGAKGGDRPEIYRTPVMSAQGSAAKNPLSAPDTDPKVVTTRVTANGYQSDVFAYLAKPTEGAALPGVVVLHENKGLTPHIEDVTRRLAREGFVAIAPDLLSRRGGTSQFSSPIDATSALKTIRGYELDEDLNAVISLLACDANVDPEKIGVIGFCFGGGVAWRLVTKDPRIKAAVPFYGVNPPIKYVPEITASVLAIYGELDDRINSGIDEITAAMELSNKTFEKIIYPGARHAFHNDTNPDRYHPEAARQAWQQALAWLRRWLN